MNFTPQQADDRRPWIQPPAMLSGVIVLLIVIVWLAQIGPAQPTYCELPTDVDRLLLAPADPTGAVGHDELPVSIHQENGRLAVRLGMREIPSIDAVADLVTQQNATDMPLAVWLDADVTVADAVAVVDRLRAGEVKIASVRYGPRFERANVREVGLPIMLGGIEEAPSSAETGDDWSVDLPPLPEPETGALTETLPDDPELPADPAALDAGADPWREMIDRATE